MSFDAPGFIREVTLIRDQVADFEAYPFSIPAIRGLHTLKLNPRVTFLVGENGSGKSTLIEAIAVAAGLNAEGGSRNFAFSTRNTESELNQHLRLVRGIRPFRDGFFLRAESFYNAATYLDELERSGGGAYASYGGKSLHERSHGESFLALLEHRFGRDAFYVLDEPGAGPQRAGQWRLDAEVGVGPFDMPTEIGEVGVNVLSRAADVEGRLGVRQKVDVKDLVGLKGSDVVLGETRPTGFCLAHQLLPAARGRGGHHASTVT